jgi:hypothetical protein
MRIEERGEERNEKREMRGEKGEEFFAFFEVKNLCQSVASVLSLPAPVYRQVEQAGVFY